MNRRKILKWLGLAPIAAVAPAVAESSIKGYVTDGKSYPYSIYPGNFYGPAMTAFELAPIKAEGEMVAYDEFSHDGTDFNPEGTLEDKYWEQQRLIDELEEERSGVWVSYTVEGVGPNDRVRAVAQPKP